MQEKKRYIEQNTPLSESNKQALRVKNGGRIQGVEGGLRLDTFDHDVNSEYDFTDNDCTICELPEHSQNLIIEDIESQTNG